MGKEGRLLGAKNCGRSYFQNGMRSWERRETRREGVKMGNDLKK